MRGLTGLALAAAMVATGSAAPREVRRLAPSSKWVVNYADDSCSLGRSFGERGGKVTVFFEQLEPGDTFTLMFVGNLLRGLKDPLVPTTRFGPNEGQDEVVAVAGINSGAHVIILQGGQRIAPLTKAEQWTRRKAGFEKPFNPQPIGAAREKAVAWLELGKILPFDLVLETGPMDEALDALRQCSWDMVRTWGLDVEQQKHLSRHAYPLKPSFSWFRADDYPREMLRDGFQAIVNFRVAVDQAGKPTSCHIQTSTRPKAFDDVVCALVMKRARFHPALDRQGKPVASYWRQTVNFRIAG
jgi:TonB family protein